MNKDRLEAITVLTALIAGTGSKLPANLIGRNVLKLARLASSLHKRYEAMCNYEWANVPRYVERTEQLERKAEVLGLELGVKVSHQRDPRGWPLIIDVDGKEMRLG